MSRYKLCWQNESIDFKNSTSSSLGWEMIRLLKEVLDKGANMARSYASNKMKLVKEKQV